MSYRKQYIPFKAALQLLFKIKFVPDFPSHCHKTYHGYSDIRILPWISRKNHRL